MSGTRPGAQPLPAVRIDCENEWAWCGDRRLALTPRAFAVLERLVEHADRLVTKDDLLATVWRDAVVSDAALASCIRDLRRALRDSSKSPRYIQTVHRRGFRFVGPVAGPARPAASPAAPAPHAPALPTLAPEPGLLVARDAELARLHDLLQRAMSGRRQLAFVTGEPGIGKTALVETFAAAMGDAVRVGRGQCMEHYGAGEAYLPVLEALGRLGRAAGGAQVVRHLLRHAPTWAMQLPGLLTDEELESARRRALGAMRDRVLREIVEALEAMAADAPLVLLLEDLHWSDASTIDLLAMLARRPEPARLLVIGTYRPADVAAAAHPLGRVKHELELHGHCEEIELAFLDASAVDEYLSRRFCGHAFPADLARVLHRATDGNPLFVVNAVDDLVGQGHVQPVDGQWRLGAPLETVAFGVPDTLWHLVEKQVERLAPEDYATLAAASVAGADFSAALAIADDVDPHEAEARCEALARRGQFLRAAGVAEWPDGTVAGQYAFIHALYQHVFYSRVSAGLRVELHRRAGERLERAWGTRAGEIAAELAMHFEQGRDLERAVRYRHQADERALRHHAYREAADHATRALELLRALPASAARIQQELALEVMLGSALTATRGYGDPEVARPWERARELCARAGDTVQLAPVLIGLGRFHQSRGELAPARELAARLLAIADASDESAVAVAAHNALGVIAFYAGQLDTALGHLEQGIEIYEADEHSPARSSVFRAGQDPGVTYDVYAAWTLQLLGRLDGAAARMRRALARARALGHPFSIVYACHFAAGFHLCRREREQVRALEDEAQALATEHGIHLFPVMGAIHRGWWLAGEADGRAALPAMREALAALRGMGIELRMPAFLAIVADVCLALGEPDEGLAAVAEAMAGAQRTGQRYWDAELHRLKGALSLVAAPGDWAGEAEACFVAAIEIARQQRARWFELRAATGLARLWSSQGRESQARALLSEICGAFTEGFDAPDLREATALLAAPGRAAGPIPAAAPSRERAEPGIEP